MGSGGLWPVMDLSSFDFSLLPPVVASVLLFALGVVVAVTPVAGFRLLRHRPAWVALPVSALASALVLLLAVGLSSAVWPYTDGQVADTELLLSDLSATAVEASEDYQIHVVHSEAFDGVCLVVPADPMGVSWMGVPGTADECDMGAFAGVVLEDLPTNSDGSFDESARVDLRTVTSKLHAVPLTLIILAAGSFIIGAGLDTVSRLIRWDDARTAAAEADSGAGPSSASSSDSDSSSHILGDVE